MNRNAELERYNSTHIMALRKSGYVALFDVLGFSDRVLRGAVHGLDTYIDAVVNLTRPHEQTIGAILFSDTVVLYTFHDGPDAFDQIISLSSVLFHALLMANVPVRGAISHGEFFRSEREGHGAVIAGRPIIEAHHYQSQLQWIGIMIAPSVLEHNRALTTAQCAIAKAKSVAQDSRFITALTALMIQPCTSIPLSNSSGATTSYEGFAIVPLSSTAKTLKDLRLSMDRSREVLERLKQLAPESRSQEKYQRSIFWIAQVRNNFSDTLGDLIDKQ